MDTRLVKLAFKAGYKAGSATTNMLYVPESERKPFQVDPVYGGRLRKYYEGTGGLGNPLGTGGLTQPFGRPSSKNPYFGPFVTKPGFGFRGFNFKRLLNPTGFQKGSPEYKDWFRRITLM